MRRCFLVLMWVKRATSLSFYVVNSLNGKRVSLKSRK